MIHEIKENKTSIPSGNQIANLGLQKRLKKAEKEKSYDTCHMKEQETKKTEGTAYEKETQKIRAIHH